MTRTCIVNLATGLVENVVEMGVQRPTPNTVEYTEAPAGFLFVASNTAPIGATYSNGVLTAPPSPLSPPLPPAPPSPRQWLERLSPQKQAAISAAALGSASILLWLLKASGSTTIDVTLQETKDGVAALVLAGVIDADDRALLLAP